MIKLPVSQSRLTSGGSNERFSCESGETGRCNATRKKDQCEFKEKVRQVCVLAVFLPWTAFCAPKTRVTMGRVRGARQSRWSGLAMRFQSSLNTARSAGERIINLLAREVNPAFLAHSPRYAVLTS